MFSGNSYVQIDAQMLVSFTRKIKSYEFMFLFKRNSYRNDNMNMFSVCKNKIP